MYRTFMAPYTGRRIVIGTKCVSWFHDRALRPRRSPQRQYAPYTWNHSAEPLGSSNTSIYVGACVLQTKGVVRVQNRVTRVIYFLDYYTNCTKEKDNITK